LGGEALLAHLLASATRKALGSDAAHALALAEGGVKAQPTSADARLALAEAQAANARVEDSRVTLSALLSDAPEWALVIEPVASGGSAGADAQWALLGGGARETAEREVMRGRAEMARKDLERAAEAFRRALALDPGMGAARRDLGALLLEVPLDARFKP